jgi:hypothetical protein
VYRISADDAQYLESHFTPTFVATDLMKIENFNAYVKLLVNSKPAVPFNIRAAPPSKGVPQIVEQMQQLSYLKFGRDRGVVDGAILKKYQQTSTSSKQATQTTTKISSPAFSASSPVRPAPTPQAQTNAVRQPLSPVQSPAHQGAVHQGNVHQYAQQGVMHQYPPTAPYYAPVPMQQPYVGQPPYMYPPSHVTMPQQYISPQGAWDPYPQGGQYYVPGGVYVGPHYVPNGQQGAPVMLPQYYGHPTQLPPSSQQSAPQPPIDLPKE